MIISAFSVLMAILWFNIFIIGIVLFRKNNAFIAHFSITALLLLIGVCILRLFCVFEFESLTIIIPSYILLPLVKDISEIVLLSPYGYDVTIMNSMLFFWLIGSVFYLMRYAAVFYKFNQYIKPVPQCEDLQVYDCMELILEESGRMRTSVKLFQSPMVEVPMIAGFFNPKIYLPELDFTYVETLNILRHEWTHYLNKDIWFKLCVSLICALFWWNPFAHILRRDLEQILEIRCDLKLAQAMDDNDRITYLESIQKILIHMAQRKETHKYAMSSAVSALVSTHNHSMIEQRFLLVVDGVTEKRSKLAFNIFTILIICLFLISNMFVIQPHHSGPNDNNGNPVFSVTSENAYLTENEDGYYSLYTDGQYRGDIPGEMLKDEPFSTLPVK